VSNARLPSSTPRRNVLDADTNAATSVFGHRKCQFHSTTSCISLTRHRFKKAKKEETFDPQLVAAVEAKLRALDVDSDMNTSGLEAVR
jgi:meiotically up-regulated gene 157 (Mug157) protein